MVALVESLVWCLPEQCEKLKKLIFAKKCGQNHKFLAEVCTCTAILALEDGTGKDSALRPWLLVSGMDHGGSDFEGEVLPDSHEKEVCGL